MHVPSQPRSLVLHLQNLLFGTSEELQRWLSFCFGLFRFVSVCFCLFWFVLVCFGFGLVLCLVSVCFCLDVAFGLAF